MSTVAPAPLPVVLLEWKPVVKNSLRGFATVRLGKSLQISECIVLASNGRLWVNLPGKPQYDRDGHPVLDPKSGKQKYSALLQWSDKAAADRFSEAVIAAIRAEHGPQALELAP
jgi:hypothetical protein